MQEKQIMIDRDLAEMYQVEVKRLNEQVKRNLDQFPDHFGFQLTDREKDELVANCDRFQGLKHTYSNPYAFIGLNKKWFAFSKIEVNAVSIVTEIEELL
jgi:hypothetical protein